MHEEESRYSILQYVPFTPNAAKQISKKGNFHGTPSQEQEKALVYNIPNIIRSFDETSSAGAMLSFEIEYSVLRSLPRFNECYCE
jgi:hypothetical protein